MDILKLSGIFLIGVVGSFIGAMVGSGGLISIPFLIFSGLSPQVAIATHKFGGVGLKLGATIKFWKSEQIKWSYFVPFSILGIMAAFIGAPLLLTIDKTLLSRLVGILSLVVLPVIFLNKGIGTEHHTTSRRSHSFGYLLYFVAQIFGAFFGGGGATIVFSIVMTFFGLTIIEASATTMLPSLVMNIATLVLFSIGGILQYEVGIAIFLGMLLGGWLGARMALMKGSAWVKRLFVIVVVLSAIKLIVR